MLRALTRSPCRRRAQEFAATIATLIFALRSSNPEAAAWLWQILGMA